MKLFIIKISQNVLKFETLVLGDLQISEDSVIFYMT